ncbi:MAG TPA: sigma-70 family RNA polymerase sigma factor [Acidimicrobiales bacterium]|nr:sigma-70 family RNA polymerase sigma factor [Acidimicrobiales bacterium]
MNRIATRSAARERDVETNTPEDSFDQFYGRTVRKLVAQGYMLCGDLQDAEDMAQEALGRAWRDWARVRTLEDPAGWTRRVLHNLVVSRWRRGKVRLHREPTLAADPTAPELDERQFDLVKGLQMLPVEQRRALVLSSVVGLAVGEIALDMDANEGTVRVWLSRARKAMVEQLADMDANERGKGDAR